MSLATQRCGMRLARSACEFGQAQLQGVVTEDIGHGLVDVRLFPTQQTLPWGVRNHAPNSIIDAC